MIKAIASRKELSENSFYGCVSDILLHNEVMPLKDITHHISTTRYQHCLNVAYYSYIVCKKFNFDARAAARAGMLHDLFYYNRKEYNNRRRRGELSHSQMHSLMAAENASKLFELSPLERDIIEKHMWPVTRKAPSYKESYVICAVDKYCAVLEFILPHLKKYSSHAAKIYPHAMRLHRKSV